MIFSEFKTTTQAKWILVGEHAVLRGHPALAFPIQQKQLTLHYIPKPCALSADFYGEHRRDLHLLFWSVIEQAMRSLGHSLNQLHGLFHLTCHIPIGSGMGASAALCVAVTRFLVAEGLVPGEQLENFATELENLFHGKSSGLDIACVSASSGIYFKQGQATPLAPQWQPHWALSSCGQIGITAHCIKQVQDLWTEDRSLAEATDDLMARSVEQAFQALQNNHKDAQLQLANAINLAESCFQTWGLVSENLQTHMSWLKQQGAIAVKPTGSGKGGYALSLWENPPPLLDSTFIVL